MKNKRSKGILKVLHFFVLFFCMMLTAAAQDSLNIKKHTYSSGKFERKMQKKNVQVLDVRTAAEYAEGHLPNAMLIDVQKPNFKDQIATLDKNKTYLIYCKSGRRSEKALKVLHAAGFKNAYHLKGGYLNWQGEKVQ